MYEKYEKEKMIATEWSGGKTTQLFIYPIHTHYLEKTFDFRISTSTVESVTSTFTALPDYHRHLMILNGSIDLRHENHYEKRLNAFEKDEFEGFWKTTSIGTCVDFNVMIRSSAPYFAELSSTLLSSRLKQSQISLSEIFFIGFYVFQGEISLSYSSSDCNQKLELKEGDFFYCLEPSFTDFIVMMTKEEKQATIITAKICKLENKGNQ